MRRNYEQMINDFNTMFGEKSKRRFPICVSDLNNIRDNNNTMFDIIENAIKYGYIMGYKYGKRN